jgi:hypothetical protein
MIAKIGRGSNLYGALVYNQLKVEKDNGQVLYTNKIIETPDGSYATSQLLRSFEPYLLANRKTEKPILHIFLNLDPKDKVSDEKFKLIGQEYMQKMGYAEQPFVVFKHIDIDVVRRNTEGKVYGIRLLTIVQIRVEWFAIRQKPFG